MGLNTSIDWITVYMRELTSICVSFIESSSYWGRHYFESFYLKDFKSVYGTSSYVYHV